ncbi:branched-chain amino acid ABC transporter permease [Janibacter sp. UYMM211]|uniref:branched-chain amino acid ABC transporter permease n=1 Tax=Janibacter sp. UYMM211 TaxID=3156342 RepID=UPI0033988C36
MSTATTAPQHPQHAEASAPADRSGLGVILGLVGGALLLVSGLLSWSYEPIFGDISIRFWPVSLQIFAMLLGITVLVVALSRSLLAPVIGWFSAGPALLALGIGSTAFAALSLVGVAVQAGGLINANEGVYVALLGALLTLAGGVLARPLVATRDAFTVKAPSTVEIALIAIICAVALAIAAYALGRDDAWVFVLFLVTVGVIGTGLAKAGFFGYVGAAAQRHRHVLTLGAFAAAFLFPFTQDGSEINMSIATGVLIFATTAIGLNIVVGLAGLLDLGYIAFLGAGAYVGAILSGAASSQIDWHPPFIVTALIGGLFSAFLGLIVGSPTLRVSGDYLAIVTLAFGEIFRLTMFNLDGNNGPDLTNGPNGVTAIPNLKIFGFDFGATHTVAGIELSRAANYYLLMLLLTGIFILVFARMNNSRIGRGWVAIREDERAAEAMGVNVFGLKLLAFAGGAFLAGIAGTVKAHYDTSVTPDQYQFLESAFLLAAVVLGGMGTIAGVILGAVVLKLMPEKLRFFSEYRLLLFGLLLVLMMRFRPEGLVASRRRQLEFHEDDEELAEVLEDRNLAIEEETR